MKEGVAENPEALFPLLSMRSRIPAKPVMDTEVRNFMDIGNQEKERRAVGVDRDAWRPAGTAGEITELRRSAGPELELKWSLLPKTQAIGHGGTGNMSAEQGGEFGSVHGFKMAIKNKKALETLKPF